MTMHSSLRIKKVVKQKGTAGQQRRSPRKRELQRANAKARAAEAKRLGISDGELGKRNLAAIAHLLTVRQTYSGHTSVRQPEFVRREPFSSDPFSSNRRFGSGW